MSHGTNIGKSHTAQYILECPELLTSRQSLFQLLSLSFWRQEKAALVEISFMMWYKLLLAARDWFICESNLVYESSSMKPGPSLPITSVVLLVFVIVRQSHICQALQFRPLWSTNQVIQKICSAQFLSELTRTCCCPRVFLFYFCIKQDKNRPTRFVLRCNCFFAFILRDFSSWKSRFSSLFRDTLTVCLKRALMWLINSWASFRARSFIHANQAGKFKFC